MLLQAIEKRLGRGEQSLVFLNRRGYAPVLACAQCGWISRCLRCAANLVLHLADGRLRLVNARAVAIANVVFTIAAVLAVVDDVWPLTTTGVAMMIVSAVYTLAMAELQYQGVRRA